MVSNPLIIIIKNTIGNKGFILTDITFVHRIIL